MAARKPSSRDAFRRVFPGVMLAMFLAAADQTILASALPSIASALGVIADLSWVVVAYLLAATVAAPLYGYVGDRFGRRRALLGALAVFTVASCACSLAPSFWWLVGFRALQGLGGGGLMTLAQALIGEHVAPRERGRYAGYFATVFALASTSGPVLGAYLTEHVSWRAIFLINIPLGVIAAALAMRVPHVAPRRRAGPFRPDVAGAILFCIATAAFLFAISSGGHRFPWLSLPMAVLLAITAGAFAALAWWERRHHDPIIPIHFLKVPAIARADAVVLCFGACLFPLIVYLPLYLQLGRGIGDLLPTAINLRADDRVANCGVDSTFVFMGTLAVPASRVSRAKAVRLYFSGMTVEVPKAEPYALVATARGLTKFIALRCGRQA